ncbi:MAG: thioredoxin family protein [Planctomycetaceae bacterium]|nr:thioredoxin family protein [Planctomycetaceae bacterium]
MTQRPLSIMGLAASLLIVLSSTLPLSAGKFNAQLSVGDKAPVWTQLQGVDGKRHSLGDFERSPVIVVAFLCNHCPIASGYEARFKQFADEYRERGVTFVGISVSRFPTDSFEKMQQRATERKFNFAYLHDPTQDIGRRYGATCTPHLFVLDRERKIAYMGAFDDSPAAADKVQEPYVRAAVDALLAGKPIDIRETRQRGCDIEYETDLTKP